MSKIHLIGNTYYFQDYKRHLSNDKMLKNLFGK